MPGIRTIVGLDTETTGLLSRGSSDWKRQPAITQIGLVKLVWSYTSGGWEIIDELEMFIDPEVDEDNWSQEAQDITGITAAQTKDAPNLMMAHREITDFMIGADALLGYNIVDYDVKVLSYQLQRYSLDHLFPWPPRHIDLMRYAPHYQNKKGRAGVERPKLGELYKAIFEKELEGAHGALVDIRATAEIFIHMGGLKGIGL